MIQAQIQFDGPTHALAKQGPYAETQSLAAMGRDRLIHYLAPSSAGLAGLEAFTVVASGQSRPGTHRQLSELHDEALAKDFAEGAVR